ncbi:hypothetical protein Pelo_6572 [Pelomyxa schiedti]|nr:hypothetical protein Pelo_6572 [Pelomyxa schiedti]
MLSVPYAMKEIPLCGDHAAALEGIKYEAALARLASHPSIIELNRRIPGVPKIFLPHMNIPEQLDTVFNVAAARSPRRGISFIAYGTLGIVAVRKMMLHTETLSQHLLSFTYSYAGTTQCSKATSRAEVLKSLTNKCDPFRGFILAELTLNAADKLEAKQAAAMIELIQSMWDHNPALRPSILLVTEKLMRIKQALDVVDPTALH